MIGGLKNQTQAAVTIEKCSDKRRVSLWEQRNVRYGNGVAFCPGAAARPFSSVAKKMHDERLSGYKAEYPRKNARS